MEETNKTDYLLGVNEKELERLRFQHQVWGGVTDKFFERIGVQPGWKCLDVGSGPGFVTIDLRKKVGSKGEVTALEPSEFFLNFLKNEVVKQNWKNIKFVNGTAEQSWLPENYYDLIFVRWVISFASSPLIFLNRLVSYLAPGGIIAIEDYAYEGSLLFPHGGDNDIMPDAVRRYYSENNGDMRVGGKLPAMFRKAGLKMIDYHPNCLAGGPESGIYQWAHTFFKIHTQLMVDKGILTQERGDAVIADWHKHDQNPDSVFFSPVVVDAAGRKEK